MADDDAFEDMIEFLDDQIDSLYDEDPVPDRPDKDAYDSDGEKAKWTYFRDFSPSEQEMMERDFTSLFDDLYNLTEEKLETILSELTVIADPSIDVKRKNSKIPLKSDANKKSHHVGVTESPEKKLPIQNPIIVCMESEDSEEFKTPKSKCDALLKELKDLRTSVLAEIGTVLDTKYTLYRRSLGDNRTKNHTKLVEARSALMLFKRNFENESSANMKDRDRQLYIELEDKYQNKIAKLEEELNQYIASVNLKTQRNLGLNEELSKLKNENGQLTGKCERIFDDLTNSYKRCEHAEKRERISKRKLFEVQKRLLTLQKAVAKQAKRGKRTSRSTVSNQFLMTQLSMSESEMQIDENDDGDFIDSEEQEPCSNCPILQEQLDIYKQKLKVLKSNSIDRSDTGTSDISACRSSEIDAGSRNGSRNCSRVGSPNISQSFIEETFQVDESDKIDEVGEQYDTSLLHEQPESINSTEIDDISQPFIVTEDPNVPSFDDHSHNNIPNSIPEDVMMLQGHSESAVSEVNCVDESIAKEDNTNRDKIDDGIDHHDEIKFINNSEDVTVDILKSDVDDLLPDQHELNIVESQDVSSRRSSRSCNLIPSKTEDSIDEINEVPISITPIHVEKKVSPPQVKNDANDDISVQSQSSTIVADITAVINTIEKQDSKDLISLESSSLTDADEEGEVHEKKPRKKKPATGHHHSHDASQNHSQHHKGTHHYHKSQHSRGHQEYKKHSNRHNTQVSLNRDHEGDKKQKPPRQHFFPEDNTPHPPNSTSFQDQVADISSRMSSILHSPTSLKESTDSFPAVESCTSVARKEMADVKQQLCKTQESQRILEKEVADLKKDKKEQDKYISELSGYIRTQDHIYNLKLKEREILLRELTQQTNDLRGQIVRDKKVFDEMKELANSNLPKIGLQKIKSKKLSSKSRREEMNFYKVDLNSNDLNSGQRPATSGGLLAFNAGLPTGSHHVARPDSSPALNLTNSVREFCGATSPSRPSQFYSTGITPGKVEQSWKDHAIADKLLVPPMLDDHNTTVRGEVEDVRKKVALLVSHQDITMKRLRAKPGVSIM